MNKLYFFLLLLFPIAVFSQIEISGSVTDVKGNPIPGANVFLEGTYDGTTSDSTGHFSFSTTETGRQTLVVSFLAFETSKLVIDVENFQPQTIKLRESVNTLDAVVVTAGTFEAGDKARVSVLKPLDIVTTAGSAGDIVAALQTLPGTQTVGESGRLFVRGGEADETQTFIDGIRVAQPYGASTNNLPTRGRFSPFLFSGISFSTGGYSAEYGEALSSVLLLNTQDDPDQNKTDISLMTVGLGVGHTQKWAKSSLSVNTAYIDLTPYHVAVPQNLKWSRPFQSFSGEAVYRYNTSNGIFKAYAAFDASHFDVTRKNINAPFEQRVNLHNDNFYLNASYRGTFGSNWQMFGGVSYGYNHNDTDIILDNLSNTENAAHLKFKLKKNFSDRFKLSVGADYFVTDFSERFQQYQGAAFPLGYDANIAAAYTEADIYFSRKLAAKAGIRVSNSDLLDETMVSPRVSVAYKVSRNGQFSFAFGQFSQSPRQDYLKYSEVYDFESEHATHYILNYQSSRDRQTFRAEVYHKAYDNLVKFSTSDDLPTNFNNGGSGYARGIDIFWRDGKSIKNLEYWLSYSFIDSERNYRDYPYAATPNFIASQNLSVVTKYWISEWKSQVGFANTFSTGRPFHNPNQSGFMTGKTRGYNNLSFNWAYLLDQQKILYFSVSNVLGNANVFGYEYANAPDANGNFQRQAVVPTADRFFFLGFFWTISDDKKSNQLDNL